LEENFTVNVGGNFYVVKRKYLDRLKGVRITAPPKKDGKWDLFLDRDGTIFAHVLLYFRNGKLPDLNRKELLELRFEAIHFSLATLRWNIDTKLKAESSGSKFAVLRYNETSSSNYLCWQGKTAPCDLKTNMGIYRSIDDVLCEVDDIGWRLNQMSGDGEIEGGWMYIFSWNKAENTRLFLNQTAPAFRYKINGNSINNNISNFSSNFNNISGSEMDRN